MGLDRDLGFSRGQKGYQGHRPHDDDDNEEVDNKVEDNNKDYDNSKGYKNDKGISVLRFWGGHQGHPCSNSRKLVQTHTEVKLVVYFQAHHTLYSYRLMSFDNVYFSPF